MCLRSFQCCVPYRQNRKIIFIPWARAVALVVNIYEECSVVFTRIRSIHEIDSVFAILAKKRNEKHWKRSKVVLLIENNNLYFKKCSWWDLDESTQNKTASPSAKMTFAISGPPLLLQWGPGNRKRHFRAGARSFILCALIQVSSATFLKI